jgi:hypothetical protein
MNDAVATVELWRGLAVILRDQALIAESKRERQLALEMAGMAADFAQYRCDMALRDMLDNPVAA